MGNNQSIWRVVNVTNFGDKPVIMGAAQFGFHVHTGECYYLHYDKGCIGLIENDRLAWTAGENDPGFAPVHYCIKLMTPKYISRAFHQDVLLIADSQSVYKMDIATHQFRQLIDKVKTGVVDMATASSIRMIISGSMI
jgi:hypothetical protein